MLRLTATTVLLLMPALHAVFRQRLHPHDMVAHPAPSGADSGDGAAVFITPLLAKGDDIHNVRVATKGGCGGYCTSCIRANPPARLALLLFPTPISPSLAGHPGWPRRGLEGGRERAAHGFHQ